MTAGAAAGRRGALFGVPDFRRLWLAGFAVFVAGRRGLPAVLAVCDLGSQHTVSAFLVALMPMLRLLPMGLFGAPIGAITERLERRTALLLVTTLMLVATATVVALAHAGALAVWHLAV